MLKCEKTNRQLLHPHIYIMNDLFSGHHAQGPYKQRYLSENINYTQFILPENHPSTSHSCEDSTEISIQCFSNYKVLMNHLETVLKHRFSLNWFEVEPKCLHSRQASVDTDAADLQTMIQWQGLSIFALPNLKHILL